MTIKWLLYQKITVTKKFQSLAVTYKELKVLGPVKSGTDVSLLLSNQLQDPGKRRNTY